MGKGTSENSEYQPIEITDEEDLVIWGVLTRKEDKSYILSD